VSFLVNFGANLWILDNNCHTALHAAHACERDEIVHFLDYEMAKQVRRCIFLLAHLPPHKQKLLNPKMVQRCQRKELQEMERRQKYVQKSQRSMEKLERHRREKLGHILGGFPGNFVSIQNCCPCGRRVGVEKSDRHDFTNACT
jgi:hypothetical protein